MSWISRRHPKQTPMSPYLTHLTGGVYTQPLPDEQASLPICKAEPDKVVSAVCIHTLLVADGNVDCLVIGERCLSGQLLLYQKRVMRSLHHCWHCTDRFVDLTIHSSYTLEQDLEILEILHRWRQDLILDSLFWLRHGLGFGSTAVNSFRPAETNTTALFTKSRDPILSLKYKVKHRNNYILCVIVCVGMQLQWRMAPSTLCSSSSRMESSQTWLKPKSPLSM